MTDLRQKLIEELRDRIGLYVYKDNTLKPNFTAAPRKIAEEYIDHLLDNYEVKEKNEDGA